MPVHFDYETFSTVDLRACGLWAYARHPSTRILCLSGAQDNDEPRIFLRHGERTLPISLRYYFDGKAGKLRAFNALFEYAITKYVLYRGRESEAPTIDKWEDTMAIARQCAFPQSLHAVAAALQLTINKDKEGPRLIQFFCKPQRDGRVNMPQDHPREYEALLKYCNQDVRVDRAVHAALPSHELHPFERRVWLVDAAVNERGVYVNRPLAKGGMALRARAQADVKAKLPKLTKGLVTSPGQRKRILAFAAAAGRPLPDLKKQTVTDALALPMPTVLRDLLELREASNLTSLAKFESMLKAAGPDGRVRGVHRYGAATTLRWGGSIVQFQNVPRPKHKLDEIDHALIAAEDYDGLSLLYPTVMGVLRDSLRNTIQGAPGNVLHVVDKASIEARVLGWLANEPKYQEAFRKGVDLYKITAAFIFNKRVEDVTDDERWVGKQSVLGQGYGQGWAGFQKFCKAQGRNLSDEVCKQAVLGFRKLYPNIPKSWYDVESCAKAAIRGKPQRYRHGIVFEMVGPHFTITLPSGRKLWYPYARLVPKVDKWGRDIEEIRFKTEIKPGVWIEVSTYGGRLVENIVQAIARDLLAEALFKCEAQKYNPVMHVHDEIVCEVARHIKGVLEGMIAIFKTPPPWGQGLILDAKGFTSVFYKKD